jgi:formylglycine-generating enzyme required for sulfatase activity
VRDQLVQWLLEANDPSEVLLVRKALLPYKGQLKEQLWARMTDAKEPAQRFRALVALARFDPDSERWAGQGTAAVAELLEANPLHLGPWVEALQPVRAALLEPLGEAFRTAKSLGKREVAATVLAEYAFDQPTLLADLLCDGDDHQFAVLFPKLRQHATAVDLLLQELKRRPTADAKNGPEAEQMALAKRQAVAAAALLRLGQPGPVWERLRHSPDPTARSYLVQRLAPLGVEAAAVAERLEAEKDVSARRALILALGESGPKQLPQEVRQRLVPLLLGWYHDDPDPGVHGAIDWLLRHAQEGPEPRKLDWGKADTLRQTDDERKGKPAEGRRWYVNKQGQTMVLIPGPVEFRMGSPASEEGRNDASETPHQRRVGRCFALASKPVTVEEFQRFLKGPPDVGDTYKEQYSPGADTPVIHVTWYEAVQYCNWLSEQDGLPEEEWCYPRHADIKEGMKPYPDYLKRKGYRLPTEAEWEYACRAGAETSHSYGGGAELLPRYGWYLHNAGDRTWPVGQKRPNDLGLFDMHGNVWNWCQEGHGASKHGGGEKPLEDEEDRRELNDDLKRVLRGGSFFDRPSSVRSAFRYGIPPSVRDYAVGLRPARTADPG